MKYNILLSLSIFLPLLSFAMDKRLVNGNFNTKIILQEPIYDAKEDMYTIYAFCNGIKAGHALFQFSDSFKHEPFGILSELEIQPNFRNKGIGFRLFDCVARLFKEYHCNYMTWLALPLCVGKEKKPSLDLQTLINIYKNMCAKLTVPLKNEVETPKGNDPLMQQMKITFK